MSNINKRKKRKGALKKGFFLFPIIVSSVFVSIALSIYFFTPVGKIVNAFFTDQIPEFNINSKFNERNIVKDTNKTIKINDFTYPNSVDPYGVLEIKNLGIYVNLYWGDTTTQLNNGIGTYKGSFLPGFSSTTLLAGHNKTYFKNLGNVNVGDTVTLYTTWGIYTYKVSGTRIADHNDSTAYDLSAKDDNLIMYTCYPFDEFGLTEKRFFVYADYVSGPKIDLT